jgi:hypothetical protein
VKGIIIRRLEFARVMIRYTFIFGTSDSWSAALLEPRLPNCTSRGSLRGRAIINPNYIYIHGLLQWRAPSRARLKLIALDGPQSDPPSGYQTSCESVPWGIRWVRAGLLRLLSHGPTPCKSTLPCQRWCPIHLAVSGVRPTPTQAELVLQLDLSVGPGGSGLTRLPPP